MANPTIGIWSFLIASEDISLHLQSKFFSDKTIGVGCGVHLRMFRWTDSQNSEFSYQIRSY